MYGCDQEIKRASLLELAQKAGLDVHASAQVIDRMREVADTFDACAKRCPIRTATIGELGKYISTNVKLLA